MNKKEELPKGPKAHRAADHYYAYSGKIGKYNPWKQAFLFHSLGMKYFQKHVLFFMEVNIFSALLTPENMRNVTPGN